MDFSLPTIKAWLNKPTAPYVVSLFRIVFGAFMVYEIIDYFRIGLVKNMFVLPAINFRYDYLTWLKPLPELWLHLILGALLVFALCMTLGLFFKWACRLFAAGYLYIFLLDKSIYNNHIYLFILLAFLLSFTDADKSLSVVSRKLKSVTIPNWQQFILQFQIVIVYFYGGLAKLRYDWLVECQPMRLLIEHMPDQHFLAGILKNDFGIYLLNYGGLLLDLGAPLFLWNKQWRRWAIYPFVLFHIFNSIIFRDIGIFPYVMISCLILFYYADELPYLKNKLNKNPAKKKLKKASPDPIREQALRKVPAVLVIYFVFQLLFPLRGYFLPNDMDWTTIGNRFSWRMKVDSRSIEKLEFIMIDTERNQSSPIEINRLINDMQILNISMDPRSAKDFASMLMIRAAAMNMQEIDVKAEIMVSYNGRQSQYFLSPDRDLTTVPYSPFTRLDWVYEAVDYK